MSSFWFFILTVLIISVVADQRVAELSRINTYELIDFNLDQLHSQNIIEFDTTVHHYEVKLTLNPDMIASSIKHTNGIPTHPHIPYFTSLTKSCHYFGKVINDNSDPFQRVSLSLCDKRGIRGQIRAFNETLIIKPAKYYLDLEYDSNQFHDITDQHLVYKSSDFNSEGIPDPKAMDISHSKIKIPSKLDAESPLNVPQTPTFDVPLFADNDRRNMLYNNGYERLELLVASDPINTKYYQDTYSSSWYQQLSSDIADYVNGVSSKYAAGAFRGNAIGDISVHLVELEVIFEFSGNYADLQPTCVNYDKCNTGWNWCECSIDGTVYLDDWNSYIIKYKDQSTFDNAQLITKYYFLNAGGWGFVGTLCQSSHNAATIVNNYGDWLPSAGAHEMGHNFGCKHDGDGNSCSGTSNIMSGSGLTASNEGWSSCSMSYIVSYFSQNDMSCLGTGVRDFTSNYGDDGQTIDTGSSGSDTDTSSGSSSSSCLTIANADSYDGLANGQWTYGGTYGGNAYYTKDAYYLFYHSGYGNWHVATELGSASVYTYCSQSAVTSCSGKFYKSVSGSWTLDSDSLIYECSSGSSSGSSSSYGCDYYGCVGISGMTASYDGNNLNTKYYPKGCNNGVGYYQSDAGYYLYRNSDGNWQVYNSLDDGYAYIYCWSDDVLGCANNMNYYSNGWYSDSSVSVYQCSSSFIDSSQESACSAKYNDEVCITNSGSLETGLNETKWTKIDSMCKYEMPVYYFEDNDMNVTQYLHFTRVKKYSISNQTIGKWIISVDDIITGDEIGYCEQDDLLSCVEGEWYSYSSANADYLGFTVQDSMRVYNNGYCSVSLKEEESDDGIVLYVVIVIIMVIVLLVVGYFIFYRERGKKKMEKTTKGIQIGMEEDEKPNQEIEVEVNVDVTHTTD